MEQLCKEAVQSVTMQNWKDAVAHCEQLEGEHWENDGLIEERVGELIISLDGDSDTYSSDQHTSSAEEAENKDEERSFLTVRLYQHNCKCSQY